MKKLFLILLSIVVALPLYAQSQAKKPQSLYQQIYQYQVDLVELDDQILATLLKVPFEKRVYVYPALFEADDVAKKIVTHPQILPWKGKKPTRIAPEMQEFAKEHLNTMPAKFYPFLDPDAWPKEDKEGDWHNVASMLPNTIARPTDNNRKNLLKTTK